MKLSALLIAGTMVVGSSYAYAQTAGPDTGVRPPVNSEIDRGTSTNNGAQGMTNGTKDPMHQGRSSTDGTLAPMPGAQAPAQNTTNPTCDNAAQAMPGNTNCKINGGSGPSN